MNVRNSPLLWTTLVASALMPATLAAAADLPLAQPAPASSWSGFYLGGQIGAFGGASTLSDPVGPSVFGDRVNTSGFLAGLVAGYNLQVAPRWVVGVLADLSYLDSSGSFTCMQASPIIIGSNCEVSPRALATVAGRVGFLLDPSGRTLIYGKAGGAWMDSLIAIHPNNIGPIANFADAVFPGAATSTDAAAWGGVVGAGIERALTPAWSVSLEYDYYRFAPTNVSTPQTIEATRSATPIFASIPSSTSGVTADLQVVKLALNYHLGQDPWSALTDAPVLATGVFPTKAPALAVSSGWQVDAGGRYWYSTGSSTNTSGNGLLLSRLPYTNLTGQSGEFFARVDSPSQLFIKGFVGAGAITSGKQNDEDWGLNDGTALQPVPTAYEVTGSSASGWLKYAAGDVGYNVFHGRNYKVGPFVGYSYFHQTMNAYGCTQLTTPGSVCDPPPPSSQPSISQDDTWQALRIGGSAVVTIWDRLAVNGDLAYLPYAQFSGLDSHWQRIPVAFFPQDGTGRGVQAELILTYGITESLNVGVGGRYWAMWSTNTSQSCNGGCDLKAAGFTSTPPSPFTTSTQRYGTFVQMSYRFDAHP
jgi:opacity protein-like surface antigen